MAKLHELLAVEGSLKAQAEKNRLELLNTFDKKKHHFTKNIVTFKPLAEGVPDEVETQLDLQTTVPQEIDWLKPFLVKAIDAGYQVAVANTAAQADVVLEDGTVLLTGVPATSLLELEKRLKEIHDFVSMIPTLDPAKGFTEDESMGPGVFKARDKANPRTKKMKRVLQLAKATDKHPEQAQVIDEDVPTGVIYTQEWSGLIKTSRKAELLSRIEDVTRSVKQARSRANDLQVDVTAARIGKRLLDHVFA